MTCPRSHSQRMAVPTLTWRPRIGKPEMAHGPSQGRPAPCWLWVGSCHLLCSHGPVHPSSMGSVAEPGGAGRQALAVNMIYRPNTRAVKSYLQLSSPRLPTRSSAAFLWTPRARAHAVSRSPALASGLGSGIEARSSIFRQMCSCPSTAAAIMQIWS